MQHHLEAVSVHGSWIRTADSQRHVVELPVLSYGPSLCIYLLPDAILSTWLYLQDNWMQWLMRMLLTNCTDVQLNARLTQRDWRWHCERWFQQSLAQGVLDIFFIDTSPAIQDYHEEVWATNQGMPGRCSACTRDHPFCRHVSSGLRQVRRSPYHLAGMHL